VQWDCCIKPTTACSPHNQYICAGHYGPYAPSVECAVQIHILSSDRTIIINQHNGMQLRTTYKCCASSTVSYSIIRTHCWTLHWYYECNVRKWCHHQNQPALWSVMLDVVTFMDNTMAYDIMRHHVYLLSYTRRLGYTTCILL
jgi:hypothetical protein